MISLRFAGPEDAARLLDIYRPYVEETSVSFETETPSLSEFRRRIADVSARFPYLVAEEDGTIQGYAYAHAFHQRAAFNWTAETSIYVRREARGRRVGTLLYRALLPLLEAQGVKTCCAVVTIPNEPSVGFHRAMGFVEQGLLKDVGYKLGAWHSVAYLCRSLSAHRTEPEPLRTVHQLEPALIGKIFAEACEFV